jgi:hypothetical protein
MINLLNRTLVLPRCTNRWPVALALLCAWVTGCTDSTAPELHLVAGTLHHAGKPVGNVMVHFDPVAAGRPSVGKADSEGNFKLRYDPKRDGVLPGEYKVWIEYIPNSPKEEMELRSGKLPLPKELQELLRKFGAKTTPLRQTINKPEPDLVLDLD